MAGTASTTAWHSTCSGGKRREKSFTTNLSLGTTRRRVPIWRHPRRGKLSNKAGPVRIGPARTFTGSFGNTFVQTVGQILASSRFLLKILSWLEAKHTSSVKSWPHSETTPQRALPIPRTRKRSGLVEIWPRLSSLLVWGRIGWYLNLQASRGLGCALCSTGSHGGLVTRYRFSRAGIKILARSQVQCHSSR